MSCPACGEIDVSTSEVIAMTVLVDAWSRLVPGAGQRLRQLLDARQIPTEARMVTCESCGLEFADPSFAVDGEWYADFERYGNRWEYFEVLRRLRGTRERILEVGCGQGWFLASALAEGHEAVGIDFNHSAVEAARAQGLQAEEVGLDAMSRTIGGKPFTVVVAFHVLEHLTKPRCMLQELHRVCDERGRLFLSCPGPRRWTTALEPEQRAGKRDVWDYPPIHQSRWTPRSLEAVLKCESWEPLHIDAEPFDLIGVSSLRLAKTGRAPPERPIRRRIQAAMSLLRFLPASLRYKGMSILAEGRWAAYSRRAP